MATSSFRRAEVWSDLECAGGSAIAVLNQIVRGSLKERKSLTGEERLTFSHSLLSDGAQTVAGELTQRRVVRTIFSDGSVDEWRILNTRNSERVKGGAVREVSCGWPTVDLLKVPVGRTLANGSALLDFEIGSLNIAGHLSSYILAALAAEGLTYFSAGTIDVAAPVQSLVYRWSSAYELCQRLAKLTNTEFRLRRNGATDYKLDFLTQLASAQPTVYVRSGRQLTDLMREEQSIDQVTRCYARGAEIDGIAATLGSNLWKVTSVPSTTRAVLADPAGQEGPIAFASQLSGMGLYVRKYPAGTLLQVSSDSALLQEITTGAVHGLAVNDLVQFRKNAAGDELTYLEDPSNKASYGLISRTVERGDIAGTINLVRDPALASWSAGLPVNFSKVNGAETVTDTTTVNRWRSGGHSARVEPAGDGRGLQTDWTALTPSAAVPYVSAFVSFWIEAGAVRVELLLGSGGTVGAPATTYVIPNQGDEVAYSSQTKTWVDLGIAGIDAQALGANQFRLRVVQHGTTAADFYLDAAQLTQTPAQEQFVDGSGGTQLWQIANRTLQDFSAPLVALDLGLQDLARLDPATFPYDDLVLGGSIDIRSSLAAAQAVTRILDIERVLDVPTLTKLGLSNRPPDLSDFLSGRLPPKRLLSSPTVSPLLVVTHQVHRPTNVAASADVAFACNQAAAQIYYVIQTIGTTPPALDSSSWTLYTKSSGAAGGFLGRRRVNLSSAQRQVFYYAKLGGLYSKIESVVLDFAIAPEVLMSVVEATAVRRILVSFRIEGNVARVRLYRAKNAAAHTTVGGVVVPDETKFVQEFVVSDVGAGGFDAAGAPVGPSVVWVDPDTSYVNTDTVNCAAVGIDSDGNFGEVSLKSLLTGGGTIDGTVDPYIASATVSLTKNGTGCGGGNRAEATIIADPRGGISTDRLLLYRRVGVDQYTVLGGWVGAPTIAAISSITRAGSVATVTTGSNHNRSTGEWVSISGCTQPEYNGVKQITVTGATTFTFQVTGTPATPATGTPVYLLAYVDDLPDWATGVGTDPEFTFGYIVDMTDSGLASRHLRAATPFPLRVTMSGICG